MTNISSKMRWQLVSQNMPLEHLDLNHKMRIFWFVFFFRFPIAATWNGVDKSYLHSTLILLSDGLCERHDADLTTLLCVSYTFGIFQFVDDLTRVNRVQLSCKSKYLFFVHHFYIVWFKLSNKLHYNFPLVRMENISLFASSTEEYMLSLAF